MERPILASWEMGPVWELVESRSSERCIGLLLSDLGGVEEAEMKVSRPPDSVLVSEPRDGRDGGGL